MSKPRRFTTQYGKHTMTKTGWYQDRFKFGSRVYPAWPPISVGPHGPVLTSVRLTPIKSDFVYPTRWGSIAQSGSISWYDYEVRDGVYTRNFRGKGAGGSMGAFSAPIGISSTSTAVAVNVPSNLTAAAKTRALGNISQGDVDVAVFLGEMPEMVRAFSSLAFRLAHSFAAAMTGQYGKALFILNGGALKDTKAAADNVVAYLYGVRPFVNELYGLQEAVKKGFADKGETIRTTGFASRAYAPEDCWSFRGDPFKFSGKARAFSRVIIYSKIENSFLHGLSQLGVVNPLTLAWELMTLSFVIDWFIPVGDFIAALTGPIGTSFSTGIEDRVFEADITCIYCRYGHSRFIDGHRPTIKHSYHAFQRIVLLALPTPRLHFGAGITGSLSRTLAAVALVRQRA